MTNNLKMKKHVFKATAYIVGFGLLAASCGGLGKMEKFLADVKYDIDPNPLIVQGDSVALNVSGQFPGKYFHKKAMVEATPTLTYEGGETAYETAYYQGEDYAGNHPVIPYEAGKSITYSDKVAFVPAMETSELFLNILGRKGSKEQQFDPYKLGVGVITTPYLMLSDDRPLLGEDAFERITHHSESADLKYLVNSSQVRSAALRADDVKAAKEFIKEAGANEDYTFTGVVIEAYASPEGEISLNENLADERAASAQKWLDGEFKRGKVTEKDSTENFYNLVPKGEDWEGFKTMMEASDIADKDLILRILGMYSDVTKREEEIKNLAATYVEVEEKILPELRRSMMTLNYDIMGKSDEEITALAKTNPDSLNVEEILYAATLTDDMNEQLRIYTEAERIHTNDWRGANNVGYIYMMQNKLADAETQFNKANGIQENPVTNNNLGIVARLKGDRKKAKDLLSGATAAGSDVSYNLGLVNIQDGDYSSANSNMSGNNTFNAALSKMLSGDAEAAKRILNDSPEKDTAMGHYLMAIIGARTANGEMVANELAAAVSMDASLKDKAMKDLEFRDYWDTLSL